MIQTMEAIRSKSHLFCLSSNKHLSSIFMRENLSFDWARRWRGEKTCGRSNFSMQNSFAQILLLTFIIFNAIFHTLVVEANNNNKKLPPRSFTQMSNMLFANEFFFSNDCELTFDLSTCRLYPFSPFSDYPMGRSCTIKLWVCQRKTRTAIPLWWFFNFRHQLK